jgi:hypothetical protein
LHSPHFDRLAGVRRNRRYRNIAMGIAIASLFFLAIFGIDPIVSASPPKIGVLAVLAALLIVSSSIATYFHLRFLTRE